MKTHDDLNIEGSVSDVDAARTDLFGARSPRTASAGATALSGAKNRLAGLESAPADLAEFLAASTMSEAVEALGVSRPQVNRLRKGYWPVDSRKIMAAWVAYQGRSAAVASSWFLRRVQSGALVRQGAQVYTGPRLGEHVGKLLALARTVDGGLVAQTLGGQPRLMVLERVEA